MLVLITYDVAISHKDGARRLRRVAKVCKNYGQRVQNSVFECVVDSLQLQKLKAQIPGLGTEELPALNKGAVMDPVKIAEPAARTVAGLLNLPRGKAALIGKPDLFGAKGEDVADPGADRGA